MTISHNCGPAHARPDFPFARAAAFGAAWSYIRRWLRMRRAVDRLRDLDDRMLMDVGLTRDSIEARMRSVHRIRSRGDHWF